MRLQFLFWLSFLFLPGVVQADGLIVQRGSNGGLQFSPAISVSINKKDKVLVLGAKPETSTPINKLQSVKIAATLILDSGPGVLTIYSKTAAPQYVYPDGVPDKKNAAPAPEAWKESSVSYRKSQTEKTPVEMPASELVAWLPGGASELAALCMDTNALKLIGGAKGAFAAQLELTAAAVAQLGSNPAMAVVERQVAEYMRARIADFDNGADSAKALDQGLQFAELSSKAFANQPEHQRYRKQLGDDKTWLDRRVAILRALAAGSQWDSFLLAYREFEKHQGSFPDLAQRHRAALKESLDQHVQAGNGHTSRQEFRRAYAELRLASSRQPSNTDLGNKVLSAWGNYSREAASKRPPNPKPLTPGEQDAVAQSLQMARSYKGQQKLDEALKFISDAERGDPNSLPVLLAKAEILGARGEFAKALAALDEYDMRAADEPQRAPANRVRADITVQMKEALTGLANRARDAWKQQRYHETARLVRQGLQMDGNDPAMLYYAGISALLTRDRANGAGQLRRYLQISNNLDGDAAQRASVSRLLASLGEAMPAPAQGEAMPAPAQGEASWFSGAKTAAGIFYCPMSLAFLPKIDHIAASNKLTLRYTWDGDKLKSIVPSFEKAVAGSEKPIAFHYNAVPQVMRVDSIDSPRKLPSDPDEVIRESNVIFPNHPLLDTAMAEQLGGKPVTVGVAGNRFFNPFVWEKPYFFTLQYDTQGRVKSAAEVDGDTTVEFEWNGMRLASVKAVRAGQVYERTMRYDQDKLMGEDIRYGNKTSKIKYVWTNGRLEKADCDKDETLDGRSRDVFFAVPAARRGGKP